MFSKPMDKDNPDPDFDEWIDEMAKMTGVSKFDIMFSAIDAWIEDHASELSEESLERWREWKERYTQGDDKEELTPRLFKWLRDWKERRRNGLL